MENKRNFLLQLRGLLPSLNPAIRKIGEYILNNPEKIKHLRIKDLAKECGVAESTITRFVRIINLESFQQLKIILAELTSDEAHGKIELVYDEVEKEDSIEQIADKILSINIKALRDTRNLIDVREIERAIEAIDKAENIDIYGAGGSFVAAENARMRLYRIGKRCIIYNDPNQQAVSASLLTEKDVAIGISNSGRTISTINALKKAKESGATTICITNYNQTPLTRYADIKLFTSTQDSAFFQESMVSRVAQIFILDIIYAGLAIKNFEQSINRIEKSSNALRDVLLT